MNYEKKYKEALELARVAAFNGHQSLMEGIFPELKESEDEKIREQIIYAINKLNVPESEKNKLLAWLENIPYTIDHEKREGFHLGYKAGLEKQGEQKPAWSEEDEVMIKVFDSIIRYIVEVVDKDALERFGTNREELFSWLKSLRPQPKQEWSEEDNWIKTKIIKVLLGCETFLTSEETNECIDWIKSIKQRLKGKS